jgi:hypothetical protein
MIKEAEASVSIITCLIIPYLLKDHAIFSKKNYLRGILMNNSNHHRNCQNLSQAKQREWRSLRIFITKHKQTLMNIIKNTNLWISNIRIKEEEIVMIINLIKTKTTFQIKIIIIEIIKWFQILQQSLIKDIRRLSEIPRI